MKIIKFILVGIVCVIQIQVFAQQTAAVSENNFSLQQCIEYAVSNHISIKSATLDQQISVAKVGEIRAAGLPQASIDALMMNNIEVQSMFARASALDKNAPSNVIVPLAFGVPYSSSATLGVTQIIFNGTLLVGLQAAKTYTELTKKAIDINKNSIIQNVSKAYYLTLINEERKHLFASNLRRMDTLLKQTRLLNQAGFAEKIDVSRLEVTYNNLLTEKQKFDNLYDLSTLLLKYQMGMNSSENLTLTDKINSFKAIAIEANTEILYTNRPEYNVLQSQKRLAELDLKSNKTGYLPSIVAFGNFGYNNGSIHLGDLYSTSWHKYSNVGLSLKMPVFDGFSKYYKSQQARLTIEKTNYAISTAERNIDLQVKQAEINLKNSTQSLNNQQNNVKLAEEVVKASEYKYNQGIGSNLEVVTAESALKEAQINYYNALYDVLVYKVDMDFALGNLK
ncbi:MAG: hypothetical protein RIQ70_1107 [Bacteroidota bacterium]